MCETILKPIILIAESATDASVIASLVDTGNRILYMINAGGYHNISSVVRTQYLMHGDSMGYIAVFDSDSENENVCQERLATVKYLSRAEMHPDRIGIFCFSPDIEHDLGLIKVNKNNKEELKQYLTNNLSTIKINKVIVDIQRFIDGLI